MEHPWKFAAIVAEIAGVGCVVKEVGKRSPYSITERRVPELIPVLGSQPTGDVSPLRPLRGLLPVLLLGEQRHNGCEQFA